MLGSGFYNMDCMEAMREFPDKFFDLAIVDPIYGDVMGGGYTTTKHDKTAHHVGTGAANQRAYHRGVWAQAKTGADYFGELFRVSKNQIVWGGNYFAEEIAKNSPGWIVWDKDNGKTTFADCELAWTSFNRAARIYRYRWNGMLQGNMKSKEKRIHPTQKPVALYTWILKNYAKDGMKILDTHVGSASSLIACHRAGLEYWGFEIDPTYFKAAEARLEREKAQINVFDILEGEATL